MTEHVRDQFLGVDSSEVAAHLDAKGLPCVIRVGEHFVIVGDFTAAELDAALADFVPCTPEDRALDAQIASTGLNLSRAQYNALRTELQTLRALRQLGRNAFMALTAAERDRMIYDALVAQTIVDLTILRDEGGVPAASASQGQSTGTQPRGARTTP